MMSEGMIAVHEKRLKIYLDSSIVSHLDQHDAPEWMSATHKLWERIKDGEFDVFISPVVVNEIEACDEFKRNILKNYLKEIDYEVVMIDERVLEIASRIVDLGILRQKSFDDCQHIAASITGGCDVLVSWNFKHMVNIRTIKGVKAITALEGYKDILILDPLSLIGGATE
jgi:predicted nucleic acid-binding protein